MIQRYFIVFVAPAVEADLEDLGVGIFCDNVADSPIALVIFGVNEVSLVVELGDGVFLVGLAHDRYIKKMSKELKEYNITKYVDCQKDLDCVD